MSTAIALRDRQMTQEQVDLIKRTICNGATNDELALFIQTSQRLNLDPFARQVFAVKRWDSKAQREVMAIQVSIDGFRLVAERTGKYAGQLGPLWTADGKEWVEVWLESKPPAAAKVGVLRADFKEPIWSVATWEQYKQEGKNGLTPMWKRMGPLMLAKCAESLALRRAFPNELSGIYTAEEMTQAADAVEYQQPAPVGPNVPVPNSQGRGSWPKHVPKTSPIEDEAEMLDREYSATVNQRPMVVKSDLEATLQRSIDANTIEVIDQVTGEVTKQPKATAPQMKKLNTLRRELKIEDKAWRAGMMKYYKIDTSTLLTKTQCQDMIERLEITKAKAPEMVPSMPTAEEIEEENRRAAEPSSDERVP